MRHATTACKFECGSDQTRYSFVHDTPATFAAAATHQSTTSIRTGMDAPSVWPPVMAQMRNLAMVESSLSLSAVCPFPCPLPRRGKSKNREAWAVG